MFLLVGIVMLFFGAYALKLACNCSTENNVRVFHSFVEFDGLDKLNAISRNTLLTWYLFIRTVLNLEAPVVAMTELPSLGML